MHKFSRHFHYFTIQNGPDIFNTIPLRRLTLSWKLHVFFLFWLHCNNLNHDDTILPFLSWCGHSYNGDFFPISCLIAQRNFFNGLGQQNSSFFAFISEMHTPREFQILIGLVMVHFTLVLTNERPSFEIYQFLCLWSSRSDHAIYFFLLLKLISLCPFWFNAKYKSNHSVGLLIVLYWLKTGARLFSYM